jgi:hypothetical protein
VRKLSGPPSLWLRQEQPLVVVEPHPPNITIRGTKKGAKGEKKGQKHHPRHLTAIMNNGNAGKEIENSDEEFIVAAERDFKRRTRPPKDHFEKILEATCPHHPYPVKHKLMYCTTMRRFISRRTP